MRLNLVKLFNLRTGDYVMLNKIYISWDDGIAGQEARQADKCNYNVCVSDIVKRASHHNRQKISSVNYGSWIF